MHLPKKKKAFLNWTLWCSGVQPAVLLSQDQSGGAAPPSRLKLYGDLSGPVSICGPEPRSRNTWGISGESLPRRKLLRSSRISMYLYFLPFFFFFTLCGKISFDHFCGHHVCLTAQWLSSTEHHVQMFRVQSGTTFCIHFHSSFSGIKDCFWDVANKL